LHVSQNFPSKRPFLEALYSPLQTVGPTIFSFRFLYSSRVPTSPSLSLRPLPPVQGRISRPAGSISRGQLLPATATTGNRAFAESEDPLGEGAFPLVEGFGERKLAAKASQRHCTGEGAFAERRKKLLVNNFFRKKEKALPVGPLAPPPATAPPRRHATCATRPPAPA
jgi:hypothetical protein